MYRCVKFQAEIRSQIFCLGRARVDTQQSLLENKLILSLWCETVALEVACTCEIGFTYLRDRLFLVPSVWPAEPPSSFTAAVQVSLLCPLDVDVDVDVPATDSPQAGAGW